MRRENGSALQVKTMGLYYAIKEEHKRGHRKLVIEGENIVAVNAMSGTRSYPWSIEMTITECRLSLQHFEAICLHLYPHNLA